MVAPFTCRICVAVFSTNTHLQRHMESHSPDRSHACCFCHRLYPRKDTARRHAKTCLKRRGRPLPPMEKRGKPRKSCDQCALIKTSCDGQSPCGNCEANARLCDYNRTRVPSQQEVTSPADTPLPPSGNSPDRLLKARIPFLLRYYNVNNTVLDLIPALESGRPTDVRYSTQSSRPGETTTGSLEATEGFMCEPDLNQPPSLWSSNADPNYFAKFDGDHEVATNGHRRPDVLSQRAQELIQQLDSAATCTDSREKLKNAVDQDLFSAANIRLFERLYAQYHHRHCPIIHIPTFEAQSATLPLLMATFLAGSLHSHPRDTYFLGVDCLDLAEAYIFSLPVFNLDFNPGAPTEPNMLETYDVLKAAVILLQLQIGRNDPANRRKVRYQRYPILVHAARSTSLFSSTHNLSSSASAAGWTWDAQAESLFRTATFILLLDCEAVYSMRSPPMITVTELAGDLPGHELMFCQQSSPLPRSPRSPSLLESIDLLANGRWDGPDNSVLGSLAVFGLFTIMSGLHMMMFSALASRIIQEKLTPLDRALSRWKILWERLISRSTEEEMERAGFMASANELWLISKAILQTETSQYSSLNDGNILQPFRELFPSVVQMENE